MNLREASHCPNCERLAKLEEKPLEAMERIATLDEENVRLQRQLATALVMDFMSAGGHPGIRRRFPYILSCAPLPSANGCTTAPTKPLLPITWRR